MDRQTEVSLLREVIGLADQKSAYLDPEISHSPISRYMSPERYEREHTMLFRRKPVVVAQSLELIGEHAFYRKKFLGAAPLADARWGGQGQRLFERVPPSRC